MPDKLEVLIEKLKESLLRKFGEGRFEMTLHCGHKYWATVKSYSLYRAEPEHFCGQILSSPTAAVESLMEKLGGCDA